MVKKKSVDALYREGIPLPDAALHFAPDNLVSAYRWAHKRDLAKGAVGTLQRIALLRSESTHDSTKQSIANDLRIDLAHPPNDPFCNRDPNKYLRVSRSAKCMCGEYVAQMDRNLFVEMRQGAFLAIGFEKPRTSKSALCKVPDDVLTRDFDVNFQASTLAGNGLEFVAVRLVRAIPAQIAGVARRTRGRPSRKAGTQAIYRRLRKSGHIRTTDVPSDVVRKIVQNLPNPPTDPTIWEHVKDLHPIPARKKK